MTVINFNEYMMVCHIVAFLSKVVPKGVDTAKDLFEGIDMRVVH